MADTAQGMTTTVLIVNWNTEELLMRCLERLGESVSDRSLLEIVVVDNDSSDGSVAAVRANFPDVVVIENDRNEGFARANNIGFHRSSGSHVLLLNSDTEIHAGAIEASNAYLNANPDVGAVGCQVFHPDGTLQNSVFRYPSLRAVASQHLGLSRALPNSTLANHDRYGMDHPSEVTEVDVVMGSFLMSRRGDVEGDLLDDGYFMYAEEADLCRRLKQQGLRVDFLPTPGIVHIAGASTRSPAQRAWSDLAKKRAVLRYLRKWHRAPVSYLANVVMLAGLVPRAAFWAAADVLSRARNQPAGRLLKAGALDFHLRALVSPKTMDERFHGPPS